MPGPAAKSGSPTTGPLWQTCTVHMDYYWCINATRGTLSVVHRLLVTHRFWLVVDTVAQLSGWGRHDQTQWQWKILNLGLSYPNKTNDLITAKNSVKQEKNMLGNILTWYLKQYQWRNITRRSPINEIWEEWIQWTLTTNYKTIVQYDNRITWLTVRQDIARTAWKDDQPRLAVLV